jgi:hypothetical protein
MNCGVRYTSSVITVEVLAWPLKILSDRSMKVEM